MDDRLTGNSASLADAHGDRYRIERELGRGGMATVFLARDLKHDRPIALKVMRPELGAIVAPARFQREISLTARLHHPHILTVYDSGSTAGRLWYTMPYVDGGSLRQRLDREKQLPLEDAYRIAGDVLAALSFAHGAGIVHRDIKPENILLDRGEAMLADFGIAHAAGAEEGERLTSTGLALGTPAYMSPEQCSGDRDVDGRSDIYSFGCVLYEMLSGQPPFMGPTAQAILARRLTEPVPPLHAVRETVSPELERVVQRAMARVPADRFASAAEFARALEAARATGTSLAARSAIGAPPRVRAIAFLSLALLAAALVGVLVRRKDRGLRTAASAMSPIPRDASIAVLPFVNLSPDRENEYFSDGMTEELITAFGRVQGLRVAARASSFAFKGKPLDLAEVGRKLNVATVLDGSVRREGTRLRVSAELVTTAEGTRLWADRYDRELRDVFAVQDELARAIVGALRGALTSHASTVAGLVKVPTRDLAAHDLYLQGRYVWNERTYASLLRAATYFERAVARDSGYAEAYAGLADTYLLLPSFGPTAPRDAFPKAKRAAERAVALDDSLAEAHASLGNVRMLEDFDWRGAETELRRAIALDSSYATGRQWYAEYLRAAGRLPEALAEMTLARELDPLSRIIAGQLGGYLALAGRYDEALRVLNASLELDPAFPRTYNALCNVYLTMDKPREAIPACERASVMSGAAQLSARLAWAYSAAGDRARAQTVVAQLEARARREYVPRYALAVGRLAVGDTAGAFAWLDSAVVARDGVFTANNFGDPVLSRLEGDPRFVRLRKLMGLGRISPALARPAPRSCQRTGPDTPPARARCAA